MYRGGSKRIAKGIESSSSSLLTSTANRGAMRVTDGTDAGPSFFGVTKAVLASLKGACRKEKLSQCVRLCYCDKHTFCLNGDRKSVIFGHNIQPGFFDQLLH